MSEIPELLQSIEYEPYIGLILTNKEIKFPDWFGNLKIDRINLTFLEKNSEVKEKLKKIFPDRIVTSRDLGQDSTEYVIQVKKSFEPKNHIFTITQLYNSLHSKYNRASFPDIEKFIEENRRIPAFHTGRVCVWFIVNTDGSISDCKIFEVRNYATREMQEEALRLVSIFPKFTPAMVSNVENEPLHKVRSEHLLWISF